MRACNHKKKEQRRRIARRISRRKRSWRAMVMRLQLETRWEVGGEEEGRTRHFFIVASYCIEGTWQVYQAKCTSILSTIEYRKNMTPHKRCQDKKPLTASLPTADPRLEGQADFLCAQLEKEGISDDVVKARNRTSILPSSFLHWGTRQVISFSNFWKFENTYHMWF